MKPFSKLIKNRDNLNKRTARIKHQVINDSDIKQFLNQYQSEPTDEMIDEDLNVLQEYRDQQKHYDSHDYAHCPSFVKGHIPELYIENERTKVRYRLYPCEIKYDEERLNSRLTTVHHTQRDTLNAKVKGIYTNDRSRLEIAMEVNDICKKLVNGERVEGLYIHGPFGTGKFFILGAIANQLKSKHVPSTIVYLPECIRILKGGFKGGSYNGKLERIREVNILMLDDIGAEDVTTWVGDEVIGPLSHYRMVHELPTFSSSNLNLEELEHHLSMSNKGAKITKVARIIERIKNLVDEFYLDGKNLRNN